MLIANCLTGVRQQPGDLHPPAELSSNGSFSGREEGAKFNGKRISSSEGLQDGSKLRGGRSMPTFLNGDHFLSAVQTSVERLLRPSWFLV